VGVCLVRNKLRKAGAIMVERWRKPNAYKHGAFLSSHTVLPGEDEQEYEELLEALTEEWLPDGAAEHEAVLTMADLRWRKTRAQRYRQERLKQNLLDVKHPSFDESVGLAYFGALMLGEPEHFDALAAVFLRPIKIDQLKRKFPRQNFASIKEWAQAIINEVASELDPSSGLPKGKRAEFDRISTELDNLGLIGRAALTFTDDVLERELAIDERLDAMFDRVLKRLIQTKAAKQALGLPRSAAAVDQPTKNAAARISDRVKRTARRPRNR
jgi:hypothetical protein